MNSNINSDSSSLSSPHSQQFSSLVDHILLLEAKKYNFLYKNSLLTQDDLKSMIHKLESELSSYHDKEAHMQSHTSLSSNLTPTNITENKVTGRESVNRDGKSLVFGPNEVTVEEFIHTPSDTKKTTRSRSFSHSPVSLLDVSSSHPIALHTAASAHMTLTSHDDNDNDNVHHHDEDVNHDDHGTKQRNSHPGTTRLSLLHHNESFRDDDHSSVGVGGLTPHGTLSLYSSPRAPIGGSLVGSPDGSASFTRRRSQYRLPSSMLPDQSSSSTMISRNTIHHRQSNNEMNHSDSNMSIVSGSSTPSNGSIESTDRLVSSSPNQLTNQQTNSSSSSLECSIIEADFSSLIDDDSSSLSSSYPPKLSWSYPKHKSSLSIAGISNFCFPSGVNLQFLHYHHAKKLIGSHSDERHILQFTDENGYATYSCVVISYVAMLSPSHDVTKTLIDINKRSKAANTLKSQLVKLMAIKKHQRWNNAHISSTLSDTSSTSGIASSSSSSASKPSFFSRMMTFRSSKPPATPYPSSSSSNQLTNQLTNSSTPPKMIGSPSKKRHSLSMLRGSSSSSSTHGGDDGGQYLLASSLSPSLSPSSLVASSDLRQRSLSTPTRQLHLHDHTDDQHTNQLTNQHDDDRHNQPEIKSQSEEEIIKLYHDDHVIVSRRAYCIITREPLHTKVFQVLQAMADAERVDSIEVTHRPSSPLCESTSILPSSSATTTVSSSTLSPSQLQEKEKQELLEKRRRVFLDVISRHITSSHPHSRLRRSRQSFDSSSSSSSKTSSSKTSSSSNVSIDRISVPGYAKLHLHHDVKHYPKLKEWSVAVLLTYMTPQIIIKVINLLLIEKSLIIYGKQRRPGVVTAVSLAVKSLISPFSWEGVSVPLVPDDVRELFESPVPFIVGTITQPRMSDVTSNTAVLVLDETVKSSPSSSSSLLTSSSLTPTSSNQLMNSLSSLTSSSSNEVEYLSWFLHIPELNTEMPCIDGFEQLIADAKVKLHQSMSSSLSSSSSSSNKMNMMISANITPDIYYTSNMSQDDRDTVATFMRAVHENNFLVCGDMNTPASWKKYIKVNYMTGELSFQPHLFLEPLRCRMEWIEAVANTQHFMSYVEQQQVEYLAEEHRLRLFIHDFILYHWIKRKLRQHQQTSSSPS